MGATLISGSGATIVFILEAAMQLGLHFNQVFSVGNCAQIGVEDALEYMDETYVHGKSSPVIMLYIESMNNPAKLAKHAKSLIAKGAKIAAIKAGYSEAGSRAASSHTGAMASPDKAVNALFRKTGIVRCYSRTELVTVAAAMMYPEPNGRKVAIVTHAGGPAVMQTDVLSSNGIEIPRLSGPKFRNCLQDCTWVRPQPILSTFWPPVPPSSWVISWMPARTTLTWMPSPSYSVTPDSVRYTTYMTLSARR